MEKPKKLPAPDGADHSNDNPISAYPELVAWARPYAETNASAPTEVALLRFHSKLGDPVYMTAGAGDLAVNPKKVVMEMANRGFPIAGTKHVKAVANYLTSAKTDNRIRVTKVPGWHDHAYALPDCWIHREGEPPPAIFFDRNSTVKLGLFEQAGDLKTWKDEVATAAKYSTRARLFLALAFAAPILERIGGSSFGVDIVGPSSKGKSLMLRLASSVAGMLGPSGLTTFATSVPALEQQLLGHRDCFFALDEVGAIAGSPKEVAALMKAFTFGSVGGRQRELAAQYEAAINAVKADTRFVVGMTSETSLTAIAHSAKAVRLRGEEVRIMELKAYGPEAMDVFDTPKALEKFGNDVSARAHYAEQLELACKSNQGVALRAFVQHLVNDGEARKKLRDYVREFKTLATVPRALEQRCWPLSIRFSHGGRRQPRGRSFAA
jgi:putative DNA primase/helicase